MSQNRPENTPDASRHAFIDAKRRGLLQGALVAAGAGVAANAVASDGAPVEETVSALVAPASKGYELTDHVREYYAKARF